MSSTQPYSDRNLKIIEISRKDIDENHQIVSNLIPHWPCYNKDGANLVMSFRIETLLIIKNDKGFYKQFRIEEIESEE